MIDNRFRCLLAALATSVAAQAADHASVGPQIIALWDEHEAASYETHQAWVDGNADLVFTTAEVGAVRRGFDRAESTARQLALGAARINAYARSLIKKRLKITTEFLDYYREWLRLQPEPPPEPPRFTIRLSGGRAIVDFSRGEMAGAAPGIDQGGGDQLLFASSLSSSSLSLEVVRPALPWSTSVVRLADLGGASHSIDPDFFRTRATLALLEVGLTPEQIDSTENLLLVGVEGVIEELRDTDPAVRAEAVAALPLETSRFLASHVAVPAGLQEQITAESAQRHQLFASQTGSSNSPSATFENALLRVRVAEALQQTGPSGGRLLSTLLARGGVNVVAEFPDGARTISVSRHTQLRFSDDTLQIDAHQVPLANIKEFTISDSLAKPPTLQRPASHLR